MQRPCEACLISRVRQDNWRKLWMPPLQAALGRGDADTAIGTVLRLARRGYIGAGRAAAVLAAGGHLEGREPGLAAELLAHALAYCPAGELPSLLGRWVAADRATPAGLLATAADTADGSGGGSADGGLDYARGGSRRSARWLARRLRGCFASAGAAAARSWALLPHLGDAHMAMASFFAMGLQPAMASLEEFDGRPGLGATSRAALLLGMCAAGIHALEPASELPDSDTATMGEAAAVAARGWLTLTPWAVLQRVRQLPDQLSDDAEAARAACLGCER